MGREKSRREEDLASNWGIRYLVIAVGSKEDEATEEDLDALSDVLSDSLPLHVTKLSPRVSDQLTVSLFFEKNAI